MSEGPSTAAPIRAAVVLLAAGAGQRVGADRNKVLLDLDGLPVLAHSLRTVMRLDPVHRVVVVVRPGERAEVGAALAPHIGERDLWLVEGGAERHDSEYAALQALRTDIESGEITVVAIHDGARPLAGADLFQRVLSTAAEAGSAVPAVTVPPLSRDSGAIVEEDLLAVQTPQAFAAATLLAAYDTAAADGFSGTDTAACLEHHGTTGIRWVAGERRNLKVTFPEDLALAAELISSAPDPANG